MEPSRQPLSAQAPPSHWRCLQIIDAFRPPSSAAGCPPTNRLCPVAQRTAPAREKKMTDSVQNATIAIQRPPEIRRNVARGRFASVVSFTGSIPACCKWIPALFIPLLAYSIAHIFGPYAKNSRKHPRVMAMYAAANAFLKVIVDPKNLCMIQCGFGLLLGAGAAAFVVLLRRPGWRDAKGGMRYCAKQETLRLLNIFFVALSAGLAGVLLSLACMAPLAPPFVAADRDGQIHLVASKAPSAVIIFHFAHQLIRSWMQVPRRMFPMLLLVCSLVMNAIATFENNGVSETVTLGLFHILISILSALGDHLQLELSPDLRDCGASLRQKLSARVPAELASRINVLCAKLRWLARGRALLYAGAFVFSFAAFMSDNAYRRTQPMIRYSWMVIGVLHLVCAALLWTRAKKPERHASVHANAAA